MDKYLKLIPEAPRQNSASMGAHVADARECKVTSTTESVHAGVPVNKQMINAVEMIFIEPREKVTPINPKFPCCPACAFSRYWISSSGKVVCGKCGETRFILASISYHVVN
jgi:hypothetical protein